MSNDVYEVQHIVSVATTWATCDLVVALRAVGKLQRAIKKRHNISHLWANVHQILEEYRGMLRLKNLFPFVSSAFRSKDIRA